MDVESDAAPQPAHKKPPTKKQKRLSRKHSRAAAHPPAALPSREQISDRIDRNDSDRTGLTSREIWLLQQLTTAIFLRGEIDLAFMSIHFLELTHLRWTPTFLQHDPVLAQWSRDENGMALRRAWAHARFREIHDWWRNLHSEDREDIIKGSRLAGLKSQAA